MLFQTTRLILLENGDWEGNSSYFKFENIWLQEEEDSWIKLKNGGRTTLVEVVQILFYHRNWGVLKKISLTGTVKSLASWKQSPIPRKKDKMLVLKMDLQQIAKAEEESRKQKFSCLLLKKGDRNTKYIQRIANSHRRNNQIDILKVGRWDYWWQWSNQE